MIYFDNAASTYKKPLSVQWATLKAIRFYTANPGRSGHELSFKAAMEVYKVRKKLQEFFNADSITNVIFTGSCTEALNLAILGCAQTGTHIIITANEHNSVLRAVEHLAQTQNIRYTVVLPNEYGIITPEAVSQAILPDTTMLIVNHTSNVTGATSNVGLLGDLAKQKGILFLVDGAQSAGHEPLDVKAQHINLLALAGHKGLMGLQGVGVLITNGVTPRPIKFGGTGTHSESPI